jgi:uncharacterized glyoxalase superfamily protein PhnB
MSDKTPPMQVWPTLRARDARALIDFYVAAFGFDETVAYRDDHGRVVHAELAWPHGGGIMLGQGPHEDPEHWPLQPGTFGGYAVVPDAADVDALFARAVAAGATVVQEPYDPGHGSWDCAVRDPEGNHWQFGTYRGAPRG